MSDAARKSELRFEYQVVSLDDVIEYFAKEYQTTDYGGSVVYRDWYIDAAKGKVVFRLTVRCAAPTGTEKET